MTDIEIARNTKLERIEKIASKIGIEDDDIELQIFMQVAKDYLQKVCGLTEDEFLDANTLIPAYLILVAEMYEYRSAMVQTSTKANPLIQRYINSSRKFL